MQAAQLLNRRALHLMGGENLMDIGRVSGLASVVECQPSKGEALSSSTRPTIFQKNPFALELVCLH
jgi:hypothetical protein